jgi:hypothetical protein
VPLSEEELRLLEQMEKALVAEDPKLASTLRGSTLRRHARRRAYAAAGVFVVGIVLLMTGVILPQIVVGIVGFVVMLGSAYVALVSWQGQSRVAEDAIAEQRGSFTVIEGGRAGRRHNRGRSVQHHSMMERFEERWRRRRERGF